MIVRRSLLAVALACLLALWGGVAWGDTESELDEVNTRIAELSEQIEAAQAAKTEAGEAVLAARARLQELTSQVKEARAVLDSLHADIAAGEVELGEVNDMLDHFEGVLASTRLKVADTKSSLSLQVAELYMSASTAGARFLAFATATEATVGFAYVDGAMGDSARLLDQLDILEAEEERQQGILDDQRRQQEQILADLERQRQAADAEVERVEGLEAQAASAAAEAEALVSSLTAEIARFEEHKEGLEADAAALEAELAARGSSGDQPDGPLMRPVPGPVTSPFGYRIHPIFGTRKLHTGWDLSAGGGEPIVAAADGVVVTAGPRGGYGNATVIDHGGGLATLYAHQSSMAVAGGQQVTQGQVIGYVGCTGYCTGAHLHFEVRLNGAPVDPAGYVG